AAAILGGLLNYTIGEWMGPKILETGHRWIKKSHLKKTHDFYEKHGGKTIVIARFIPIIRTFAPFVAGVSKMTYQKFFIFNLLGAILWIPVLLLLGRHFGNLPIVKENFGLVIPAIIIVSVLPIFYELIASRKRKHKKAA